jgi:hypothetical protein
MRRLIGKLFFMGWDNHPWRLFTDEGDVDLWPFVEQLFLSLHMATVSHCREKESYTLERDKASPYIFNHPMLWASVPHKFEAFNVRAYLEEILIWLSGRMVVVEIGENGFKISADPSEEVHGVLFVKEGGNACRIAEGDLALICKVGTPDGCVFCAVGAGGFVCEKFDGSMARYLLDRLAKKQMRATRIGNCAVRGREGFEAIGKP